MTPKEIEMTDRTEINICLISPHDITVLFDHTNRNDFHRNRHTSYNNVSGSSLGRLEELIRDCDVDAELTLANLTNHWLEIRAEIRRPIP
jgi:hypothetical protein